MGNSIEKWINDNIQRRIRNNNRKWRIKNEWENKRIIRWVIIERNRRKKRLFRIIKKIE